MPSKQPQNNGPTILSISDHLQRSRKERDLENLRHQFPGGIAVSASGDPSYDEIASMAVDCLSRERLAVQFVADGDVAAFNCDLILLVGSGRFFPRFAELARSRPSRPRIVLWHQQ